MRFLADLALAFDGGASLMYLLVCRLCSAPPLTRRADRAVGVANMALLFIGFVVLVSSPSS
jgi:hypothetical protein